MYDSDDEEMFLFDEEVPAHVSAHAEARAQPVIRSMTRKPVRKPVTRKPDMRLSSSCPHKPFVGSLPAPELHEAMPLLNLPSSTPPIYDGSKIMSSLFTGTRVNKQSGQVGYNFFELK